MKRHTGGGINPIASELTRLLCRLCWNSEGWCRPTGEASRLESNSYVAKNGFGHEEWLFNHEWLLRGERWAFIQALNSSLNRYAGHSVSLLLYTRSPDGHYRAVAQIGSAHVITKPESHAAMAGFRSRGWLRQMKEDLNRIGASAHLIETATPDTLANVRFRIDTVRMFDPPSLFPNQAEFARKYFRYRAFRLETKDPLDPSASVPSRPRGHTSKRLKKTTGGVRRGTADGTFDPRHDRLQNAIFAYLKKLCENVEYERDWVDLRAVIGGKDYFIEVKVAPTAKRCIREALGVKTY
jgi:hypothetical protein